MIKPYYQDDKYNITIYLGDCRDILPKLEPVDLVLTDPPYLEGDFSWLLDFVNDRLVVTPGKFESFNWIAKLKPAYEYAWQCSSASLGGSFCFHINWEPILSYCPPRKPLGSDLLIYPILSSPDKPDHPWPKPIKLIRKLIQHWTKETETILDPFMGSGTTLVAAKELGRKAIGIEIEERYVEIAIRRLKQDVFQWSNGG